MEEPNRLAQCNIYYGSSKVCFPRIPWMTVSFTFGSNRNSVPLAYQSETGANRKQSARLSSIVPKGGGLSCHMSPNSRCCPLFSSVVSSSTPRRVTIHSHSPNSRRAYSRLSFTLLSSRATCSCGDILVTYCRLSDDRSRTMRSVRAKSFAGRLGKVAQYSLE